MTKKHKDVRLGKLKGRELEKHIVTVFTKYLNRPLILDTTEFVDAVECARDIFKRAHYQENAINRLLKGTNPITEINQKKQQEKNLQHDTKQSSLRSPVDD